MLSIESLPSLSNPVAVYNRDGVGRVVLLCEHASNYIPPQYQGLGLGTQDLQRHIAWDPGASATAQWLSRGLDAPLVCATYSRLLLDLNRKLSASDSIVKHSENTPIPGNESLDAVELFNRHSLYAPYHKEVENLINSRRTALKEKLPVVISIHSFTPVYLGVARPWHIGVLSQHDRRLADALLAILREDNNLCVGDNQPYAPQDGVYHSIEQHAESHGLPCAMLEIRNDLIADRRGQREWSERLSLAIQRALHCIDAID